jgi:hypothetical protein
MKPGNDLYRADRFSFFFLVGITGILLHACSVAPSQETVSTVIKTYFEDRQYRVAELQLGTISSVPLNEKTYMGTQGHVVDIRQITLEVLADNREYRKGEKLTFTHASIRIREKVDKKGEWIIANISGIQVP